MKKCTATSLSKTCLWIFSFGMMLMASLALAQPAPRAPIPSRFLPNTFLPPPPLPQIETPAEKSQEIVRAPVQASVIDHGVFSQILKKYVSKHGLFDYASCKRDKDATSDLDRYTADLLKIDGFQFESIWEQAAYFLNLYNALVLRDILAKYPVQSVTQIPRFFEEARYALASFPGEKLSLLDLEERVFRQKLGDPRFHLMRVSGGFSSPRLQTEAYQGGTLQKKVDEVIAEFLSDASKNFYIPFQKAFVASPLFLWFDLDFARRYGSNRNFIWSTIRLPANARLQFSGFDWRLNDSKLR